MYGGMPFLPSLTVPNASVLWACKAPVIDVSLGGKVKRRRRRGGLWRRRCRRPTLSGRRRRRMTDRRADRRSWRLVNFVGDGNWSRRNPVNRRTNLGRFGGRKGSGDVSADKWSLRAMSLSGPDLGPSTLSDLCMALNGHACAYVPIRKCTAHSLCWAWAWCEEKLKHSHLLTWEVSEGKGMI